MEFVELLIMEPKVFITFALTFTSSYVFFQNRFSCFKAEIKPTLRQATKAAVMA